ncbi:hypothetical protein MCOR25_011213 [Pyricularia grisea]|nr:hypothetical protein MCOR25_011213 [Pyricularia grisea]
MVLIDWSRARCYYCNGSVLVPDYAMVAVDITHDSLASFRAEIRHLVIREKYMKMQSDGPTRRQMALNVSAMPSLNSVQLLTETNFSTLISPRYVCGHDYGDCQLYSNYLQEHTDCSHHFVRCGDEPSSPWSFRKYIDLLEQSLTLAISKSPDPPDYSDFQVCGYRDVNFGCLARLEISPPVAGDFFTPDSQWNVFDCPAGLVD